MNENFIILVVFGGFLVSDTSVFFHTFAVEIMKVNMKLKFA